MALAMQANAATTFMTEHTAADLEAAQTLLMLRAESDQVLFRNGQFLTSQNTQNATKPPVNMPNFSEATTSTPSDHTEVASQPSTTTKKSARAASKRPTKVSKPTKAKKEATPKPDRGKGRARDTGNQGPPTDQGPSTPSDARRAELLAILRQMDEEEDSRNGQYVMAGQPMYQTPPPAAGPSSAAGPQGTFKDLPAKTAALLDNYYARQAAQGKAAHSAATSTMISRT